MPQCLGIWRIFFIVARFQGNAVVIQNESRRNSQGSARVLQLNADVPFRRWGKLRERESKTLCIGQISISSQTTNRLVRLKQKSKNYLIFDNNIMTITEVANYLRSHRRKSGLSQRELANIVGYVTQAPVSEHERSVTIPALLIAMSYEVVFRVPLSELFPALYATVEANIEEQLTRIESELQQSTAKGRRAAYIARKLEWLWERRNPDTV